MPGTVLPGATNPQPPRDFFLTLALVIKSIREDEKKGKLYIGATVNCKIDGEFDLDILSFNMNKSDEFKPTFRNNRLEDGKRSGSFHHNFVLDSRNDIDYCPFIVSKYDLSIKLNSPDAKNMRGKLKANFRSRPLKDFISFQADSIGYGVSKTDTVVMRSIAKRKLDDKTCDSITYGLDKNAVTVNLHEDEFEVDEIVFTFSTRKNQLTNLVHIVMPCFIVSLILCEMSRRSSLSLEAMSSCFTAILFTIPKEFGVSTSIWYFITVIAAFTLYWYNDPSVALKIENLIFFAFPVLLLYQFYCQYVLMKSKKNAAEIRTMVKNTDSKVKLLRDDLFQLIGYLWSVEG